VLNYASLTVKVMFLKQTVGALGQNWWISKVQLLTKHIGHIRDKFHTSNDQPTASKQSTEGR